MIANETEQVDIQAGLEDFGYMENMTSVAQLREQITITGAEVQKINCHQLSKQTQCCHSGRSEQLHLGRPLCHRRRCQVSEPTFLFDTDCILTFSRALDFTCLIMQDEGGEDCQYLKVSKYSMILQ